MRAIAIVALLVLVACSGGTETDPDAGRTGLDGSAGDDGGTSDAGVPPDGAIERDAAPDGSPADAGPPACVDGDGDGYGEHCALGPDCADDDELVHPGALELCNGVDDDCDAATPDGADEPGLGLSCDGDDADLCHEGVTVCAEGALACDDTTDDNVELCDGVDDDCDTVVDEGALDCCGADETRTCGSDVGECSPGTQTCLADGSWGACAGSTGPALEVCNGLDDDCDPTTADGSADPMLGDLCDGDADADLCAEGAQICVDGTLTCDDTSGESVEICDGHDQDCDGSVDESSDASCPPPPADTCVGDSLRTYASMGRCADAACTYDFVDEVCPISCVPGETPRCIECMDDGACLSHETCSPMGECVSSCFESAPDGSLAIDVPAVDVTISVRLNGAAAPDITTTSASADHESEVPSLRLVREGTQATLLVYDLSTVAGPRSAPDRDLRLIPGTYEVVYSAPSDFDVPNNVGIDAWPRNVGTTLGSLVIDGDGTYLVDVGAVDLSFTTTLNGATAPELTTTSASADHESELPSIRLVREGTQASYLIYDLSTVAGPRSAQTRSFRLVPGSYDAVYSAPSDFDVPNNVGIDAWPRNVGTTLTTLDLSASGALTIDVPAIDLDFSTTLNGVAAPELTTTSASADHESELPSIRLVREGTQASYLIYDLSTVAGPRSAQTRSFRLIPGSYDAVYSAPSDFDVPNNVGIDAWPRNVGTTLSSLSLMASGPVTVDVPAVDLTLTTTLNGAPAPALTTTSASADHESELPSIRLVREGTQASYLIYDLSTVAGPRSAQTRSFRLVPGSYEAVYSAPSDFDVPNNVGIDAWPRNVGTTLSTLSLGGGPVTVDVPAVDLTFTTTLNGAGAPDITTTSASADHESEVPSIRLVREGTQASYFIYDLSAVAGPRSAQTRSFRLVPGEYDAVYSAPSDFDVANNVGIDAWPRNVGTTLSTVTLAGGALTVDVPATTVTFHTTLNGVLPPDLTTTSASADHESELPSIRLVREGTQASYLIYDLSTVAGPRSAQSRVFRLIPGSYDAVYSAPSDFDIPNNVGIDAWPRNVGTTLECAFVAVSP